MSLKRVRNFFGHPLGQAYGIMVCVGGALAGLYGSIIGIRKLVKKPTPLSVFYPLFLGAGYSGVGLAFSAVFPIFALVSLFEPSDD